AISRSAVAVSPATSACTRVSSTWRMVSATEAWLAVVAFDAASPPAAIDAATAAPASRRRARDVRCLATLPSPVWGPAPAPRPAAAGSIPTTWDLAVSGVAGRRVEAGEQLAPAADADLREHRLQVVLDCVGRDEQPRGDRARVQPGRQRRDQLALARGEPERA